MEVRLLSLLVWLPLLGSLENQGASNLQFTQSDTAITIDTNGKIGQCYTRVTAKTAGRIESNNTILLNGDLSICCWAKVTTTVGDTANGLVTNHNAGSNSNFSINVKQISTDDYRISCSTGNGSARTYMTYYGTTNIKNNWHHLALTYNNTTHIFQLWVDGVVEKTQSYTNSATAQKIMLFDWNVAGTNNNYKPACMLNDVRIYDHCLSAAEIHEISQGLILHYKLDGYNLFNYNTLTHDIYVLSNGNTSTSGAVGNWCLTDYIPVFPSTSYIGYNLVNGGNGNPSICFYDKNKTYTRGQAITANTPLSIMTTDTEYYVRISVRKANNDINKMLFIELPLKIQDSSGYGHNGTITGSLTLNNNTARYSTSTYISSGDTNYITTPTLQLPGDQITMNFWFRSTNTAPGSNYHMPFEGTANSNQSYEMSIHSSGYLRGGLIVAGSRKVDNCTSKVLLNGNWHMCSMTYDGATIKRYVDGVMEKSTSVTGALATSTAFVLGHYGSNTSYCAKEVYISDVRLYVTALSEADIKQLYEMGGKIDNKQNLHIYEAIEMQPTIKLTKQGQMKAGEFQEDTATKLYETDQIVETNNLIEL